MVGTLYRITSLLLAVAILLVGHGLQQTLLPLYAESLGWNTFAIGSTGSAYFLGFVVGCIANPRVISSVGHIRTFMVMAAIATIGLLGAGLFVGWLSWLVLRFASGFALSGLYMVIESWLNEVSPNDKRGTVLALYTTICLLGMAVGQSLLGIAAPTGLDLFGVGAIFLCLAIIPVGLTTTGSPQAVPALRFKPKILLEASRVAVVGAFFSGLVTAAFWTLGPILGTAFALDSGAVALLMGVGIMGGTLVQLPVGRLSDRMDRRIVIGALAAVGAGAALAGWLFSGTSPVALFVAIFFIGAATMPIYALCIAHASDHSTLPMVELASGTLMTNSLGSIVGPIVVAGLMATAGAASYFAYIFVCLTIMAIWVLARKVAVARPHEPGVHAAILPRTTQMVAELPLADSEAPPGS